MKKILSWSILVVVFIVFNLNSAGIDDLFYDSWLGLFQGVFIFIIALLPLIIEKSIDSIEKNAFRLFGYFNILFFGYVSGYYAPLSSVLSNKFEIYMILWWSIPVLFMFLIVYLDELNFTTSKITKTISVTLLIIEIVSVPLVTWYLSWIV